MSRPNDSADADEKKKERSVSAEIEFQLSTIDATGGLNFLKKVIEAAASLPPLPELPKGEAPTAYPAKIPGAGGADINVSLGPFEAPKFKLMQFEVSNVTATVGIGLNFLPRATGPSTPPKVPDNVFSIGIASLDKPLTLLAAPWGGIAHLNLTFTPKGVTGFQFSLGVVNKTEFDLGVSKATCESSLAARVHLLVERRRSLPVGPDPEAQRTGQALVHGHPPDAGRDRLVEQTACGRSTRSSSVRVQISFFAVQASFSFHHEIADNSGRQDRLLTGEDDELTEAEWTAYRSAFAKVA